MLQQSLVGQHRGFHLWQHGADPWLADFHLRAWPERKVHPPLQVRRPGDPLVRVFREDGRRVGCYPEHGSDDDGGDSELGLGDGAPPPTTAALPRMRARAVVATTGPHVVVLGARMSVVHPATALQ